VRRKRVRRAVGRMRREDRSSMSSFPLADLSGTWLHHRVTLISHVPLFVPEGGTGLGSQRCRRPTKVPAIALANKIARMAWAMMAKGECYKEPVALAA